MVSEEASDVEFAIECGGGDGEKPRQTGHFRNCQESSAVEIDAP